MRKITGNCYNQIVVKDDGNIMSSVSNPIASSMIFRTLSYWYNTREDMLRLLNGTMSGPSNLAGSDLNTNKHLWIQGGVRVTQTIRNPRSYPVFVHIYKCNLKCPDAGQLPGAYIEGTLPFAYGSANSAFNRPENAYWDFFDQSSRQLMGSAADTAYMKFDGDSQLAGNSTGGYPGGGNVALVDNFWEVTSGNDSSMDFREKMSLSWIFPEIKKKLKVRTVFRGWIPACGSRTYTYRASMPSELRPRDYLTNDCMNFSKYSYFLMIRAFAAPMMSSLASQGYMQSMDQAGRDALALGSTPFGFWRPPVSLAFTESRTYRVRRQGDSVPSFGAVLVDQAAPAGGSAAAGGWMGAEWGLRFYGSYYHIPTTWGTVPNDNTEQVQRFYPCVPSHRQRAMIDNGGLGVPYVSAGCFTSWGAK